MKNWQPQDFIALGLLLFIFAFLIALTWMRTKGLMAADSSANKEIVIYIVGVLSGYIGTRKFKNNGNEKLD